MNRILLFTLLILSSISFGSDWRTPDMAKAISDLKNKQEKFESNFYGVSGTVISIHEGYKGKPIYFLSIEDKTGKESILIGSLFNSDIKPGHVIDLLFDTIEVSNDDTKAKALTNDRVMGLGLCHINRTTGEPSGAQPTKDLCLKWFLEDFPRNYQDVMVNDSPSA